MKTKQFLLVIMMLNIALVWCTSNQNTANDTQTSTSNQTSISQDTNWKNNSTLISSSNSDWVKVKIVKVDSKCIWCWHCVRIDPNHFTMDRSIHKAETIQTNWHFWPLQQAINSCPVWAISYS